MHTPNFQSYLCGFLGIHAHPRIDGSVLWIFKPLTDVIFAHLPHADYDER